MRVSLEEGLAAVTLDPGNALDPEAIRDVARDGGFTPKAAEIRVRGHLVVGEESLALAVTGLGREYRLFESDSVPGRLAALSAVAPGTLVDVTAVLPESDGSPGGGELLDLRSVTSRPSSRAESSSCRSFPAANETRCSSTSRLVTRSSPSRYSSSHVILYEPSPSGAALSQARSSSTPSHSGGGDAGA